MDALDLTHATRIDYLTAERMIRESGGKFFRVEFTKRTNGAYRRMVARIGVKPTETGGSSSPAYNDVAHGLIRVWEPANGSGHTGNRRRDGYRSIGVERIKVLRINGETYQVVAPSQDEEHADRIARKMVRALIQ